MDSEETGLRQSYSVSILQLPNEILHDFLSFVLADAGSPKGESPRKFLFVINEVCRLFRDIAATLPFWYEPDFDFLSLYSPPPGKSGSAAQKRIFLKTLFQNSQLVETLKSRSDWIVHDSRILRTIVQCLPSFHDSAESVTFTCIHLGVNIGSQLITNLLKPCRRLKSVTFGVDCETANLNKITRSLPNLERLEIASPHRDWYSRYTLNELTCLREFRCNAGVVEARVSEEVLPLKSVDTLTSLHLNLYLNRFDWRQAHQYYWTQFLSSLGLFVNLKSLHISPLADDIALFLADKLGVTFKLISFSTALVTLSAMGTTRAVSRLTMFLDKADFSTVKEFTLVIHQGKWKHERWKTYRVKPIVEAIMKSLTHIRRLELDMPFDREWCQDFTAMTNLRELVWTTDEDNSVFDSGEEREATVGKAEEAERSSSENEAPQCEIQRKEMKAGLVKAFKDFCEVPKIVLDVRADRFMSI